VVKTKVIFCTDGIFPHEVGGMQRHSRLLIEYLAKSGKVNLVVIHPHSQKIFSENLGIIEEPVSPIDKSKNYLLECYRYSKRVYSILVKYPDYIVYAQGLTVWYNIKKISQRLIVNPHGLEPYQCLSFKDKLIAIPFKFIFNYLFRNAAKVISLGGQLTDILDDQISFNKEKINVLPNAVILPLKQTKVSGKEKNNILFVGRFAHNKGIHILIQAIKELNEEGYSDKIIFNLGGKGPLFDYYSNTFRLKNLNYLGFLSDEKLVELYQQNDLFVLPTLFEGMPTVVLEAMSFGMPVIVTNVGATSELVDDSNGFLIEKNNVKALKNAIVNFCNLSQEERNKMSDNSYYKVKNNFTWEKVAEKYVHIFEILKNENEKLSKISNP
jgi:glycosyltransferase involved in cell wall biosynthesis